jgi:hypothetical protein
MTIKAGFSEIEITPPELPVRTYFASADSVMDPLFANAAAFSDGTTTVVFLSFDVVIVEWEYVARIRRGIAAQRGIPPENVLICATHNHACPAVVDRPGSAKDEDYLDFMVERGIEAVVTAYDAAASGEVGTGRSYETRIAFNRRYIKLDGTVISQPASTDDLLCSEGVTDPGLGVMGFRDAAGRLAGLLVNYSCHACHHMGSLSAGYPGVMRSELKQRFGDECGIVFLNGACGNVLHTNYTDPDLDTSKERCGRLLADHVAEVIEGLKYTPEASIACAEAVVPILYRDISGLAANLDRLHEFNVFKAVYDRGWYHHSLELLTELHARSDHEDAHIQAIRIGDAFFGTAPAEYFAENALRIKELSPHRHTFVVSLANGWLGYVPHPAAFERQGGHETTWALWSKMEERAGEILGDGVVELLNQVAE